MNIGSRFYDEKNGVYIIIDGVGPAPGFWYCIVEEAYDGYFEALGSKLFTETELKKFKKIW